MSSAFHPCYESLLPLSHPPTDKTHAEKCRDESATNDTWSSTTLKVIGVAVDVSRSYYDVFKPFYIDR